MVNPCTDFLTDLEYLEHMIPHHQVAADMSNHLIPNTNNPTMLHLCRNILIKQKYEIWEMNIMLQRLSDTVFSKKKGNVDNMATKLEFHNKNMSSDNDGECDPLFFKPDEHNKHMMGSNINDTMYLEHMIPHHQVAIDMSKRLLLHTNNSYLIDFCRKLIIDQQGEIFLMNNLLNNKYNHYSELLDN
tara:strand:+ start:1258 stop:1818 length:561 start_codon:yes stop_codon:yes gene_type:complete